LNYNIRGGHLPVWLWRRGSRGRWSFHR